MSRFPWGDSIPLAWVEAAPKQWEGRLFGVNMAGTYTLQVRKQRSGTATLLATIPVVAVWVDDDEVLDDHTLFPIILTADLSAGVPPGGHEWDAKRVSDGAVVFGGTAKVTPRVTVFA